MRLLDMMSQRRLLEHAANELYPNPDDAEAKAALIKSLADDQYLDSRRLRMVYRFNTKYPRLYPQIISRLEVSHRYWSDEYIEQAFECAKLLREVDASIGSNEGKYVSYGERIIPHFVRYNRKGTLTKQQRRAIITVAYLLQDKLDPIHCPKDFPSDSGYPRGKTAALWLTERVLENPDDPVAAFEAYAARGEKRSYVARALSWDKSNPRNPLDFSESIVDYPTEVIDWIASTDKDSFMLQEELKDIAFDGATAQNVEEARHFYDPKEEYLIGMASAVVRLREYPELNAYPDLRSAPPEVQHQCRALITVGAALYEHSDPYPALRSVIQDPRLVQLLLAEPHRADEVASLIKTRGYSVDYDVVQACAGDALGDGYL